MKPHFPMTVLILLLCGGNATAAVYKCAGADGAVQYRDTPCDSGAQSLRKLDTPEPAAAMPDERMDKTRRLLDAMRDERQQKQQRSEEEKAEREQRRVRCNHARDHLRNMERAGRVYRLDESGNREYLPDAGREQALNDARERVRHWCD